MLADVSGSTGAAHIGSHSTTSYMFQKVCSKDTERSCRSYFEVVGGQSDHANVHEEMPYRHPSKRRNMSTPEVAGIELQVRDMFVKLCDDADVGMTQHDMEKLLAVWGL